MGKSHEHIVERRRHAEHLKDALVAARVPGPKIGGIEEKPDWNRVVLDRAVREEAGLAAGALVASVHTFGPEGSIDPVGFGSDESVDVEDCETVADSRLGLEDFEVD